MVALYVGDLHPDVTESMLFEKFSTAGAVASIRVCRAQMTRRSMGYAYVNFNQEADAERAMDILNYDPIKGRPMRIMWSHRDPDLRKSNVGNIYIKNIDKSIDNQELYDTFLHWGKILSCKIAYDENGESRGFGFVHFETEESAQQAINQVNGMLLKNKQVYVGKFMSKQVRERQSDGLKMFNNVFVKNFGSSLDEEKLRKMFEKFGEITSVKVMRKDNGEPFGYGFVTFTNPTGANAAVEGMNGFTMEDGQVLYAGAAEKKAIRRKELARQRDLKNIDRQQTTNQVNMYVKNLSDSVTEDDLRTLFENYGTVTSAKIMMNGSVSRGFGFVSLSSPEEATRAITELNCKLLDSKPLYVALAQSKEQRKINLASQFMSQATNDRMNPVNTVYPTSVTGGYFLPTMAQPQRFFGQSAIGHVRAAPRWAPQIQNRPLTPTNHQTQQTPIQQYHIQQQIMPHQMQPQYRQSSTSGRPILSGNTQHIVSNTARNYPHPNAGHNGHNGSLTQIHHKPLIAVPPQPNMSINNDPAKVELSASLLADATPAEQKQLLGERLYSAVERTHPQLAGKITGMLLEIDNSELLHMLDDTKSLTEKVREAVDILRIDRRQLVYEGN